MGMMLMTSADELPGYEVEEILGIVQGNTVRARNVGRDFLAGLKNIVGGEISEYTDLLTESRNQAIQRMMNMAERRGANAVVAVRFNTSNIMQAAAELFVYGTAVKVHKVE